MLKINTILETKDGRKIGNAIIVGICAHGFNIVTDYGTKITFSKNEIEELFYCRNQSPEEITQRSYHKHYVHSGLEQKKEINNE